MATSRKRTGEQTVGSAVASALSLAITWYDIIWPCPTGGDAGKTRVDYSTSCTLALYKSVNASGCPVSCDNVVVFLLVQISSK